MKVKFRPEDFRVEELLTLRFARRGRYSIYRLEKRNWTTLSAVGYIERKYRLGKMARAGLKDRYSCSVQYVSVEGRGPGRIDEANFSLKHIGYSNRPISRDLLLGNRFEIILRDLTRAETEVIHQNLPGVERDGFANYFDEQRFGASRPGEGFIAEKLMQGDLGGALRLYMAVPSLNDGPEVRRNRDFMDKHWGDWALCLKHAKPEFSPILYHLSKAPDDFEGALRRVQYDLRELFIAGYQSYLWNETLVQLIRDFGLPARSASYSQGELLFFTELSPEARDFFAQHEIPMACPKTVYGAQRTARAMTSVLTRKGLKREDLRLPIRIEGFYFKPYTRPGIVVPGQLKVGRFEPDELHPGKQKLGLTFELPPGSYATIFLRRLALD